MLHMIHGYIQHGKQYTIMANNKPYYNSCSSLICLMDFNISYEYIKNMDNAITAVNKYLEITHETMSLMVRYCTML